MINKYIYIFNKVYVLSLKKPAPSAKSTNDFCSLGLLLKVFGYPELETMPLMTFILNNKD